MCGMINCNMISDLVNVAITCVDVPVTTCKHDLN